MGWKSVALAGCLLPVLAGCGSVRHAAADWPGPAAPVAGGDARQDARVAWDCVCAEHPARGFPAEFRAGFLDGFAEGRARRRAPLAQRKKSAHEAHGPLCDYCRGFQYGTDTAESGWKLPPPTVPVRPSRDAPPAKPARPGSDDPLPPPRPVEGDKGGEAPRTVPKLPKPEVPVIPPFDPPLPGGAYPLLPVPPDAGLPPVPKRPAPAPALPVVPLPVLPGESSGTIPPTDLPLLPESPLRVSVPVVPASVRVPSAFDDIPPVPFQYPAPAPGK